MFVFRDGTAKGGPAGVSGFDYEEIHGVLQFQHAEATKQVMLRMNKDCVVRIQLFLNCPHYSIFKTIPLSLSLHICTSCN